MITNINEQLWIDFDLEVEFFLRTLVGWIIYNSRKDNPEHRNFHNGKYWSFNSYPEFSRQLPGFSPKIIRTIIARCIKHDLLEVSHFNRKRYDNTNWYTLTDKAWKYFPYQAENLYPDSSVSSDMGGKDLYTPAQTGSTPAQMGRPIPKELNSLSSKDIYICAFEKFWEAYPKKSAKKPCLAKWKQLKLDSKIDLILAKLEQQKTQDRQWLDGFIPNPLTYLNQERWEDEINLGVDEVAKLKKAKAIKQANAKRDALLKAQEEAAEKKKREELKSKPHSPTQRVHISILERIKNSTSNTPAIVPDKGVNLSQDGLYSEIDIDVAGDD